MGLNSISIAYAPKAYLRGRGKQWSRRMRRFSRDDEVIGLASQLESRALDDAHVREPPSPADFLARLGMLILVALCFGLTAQLLVGAQ
jgi:hypothetical protein